MKNLKNQFFLLALGASALFVSCTNDDNPVDPNDPIETSNEYAIVANRGGESVSFINTTTDKVDKTLQIKGSMPMYVVYSKVQDKIYVGDRNNDRVLVIDPETKEVVSSIPVGVGVFHMWADKSGRQLWVNNDIDKTISVINLDTEQVIKTITLPAKPHDVFVNERSAYVSIFANESSEKDSIFMFNKRNFKLKAKAAVGKDPHLFQVGNKLYSPNQGTNNVFVFNAKTLEELKTIEATGAHGVFGGKVKQNLYVTNLPNKEILNINTRMNKVVSKVETPVAIPHNLTVNKMNTKLYATHSGATADKVTIYKLNGQDMTHKTTITTGTNPFGIAIMNRSSDELSY